MGSLKMSRLGPGLAEAPLPHCKIALTASSHVPDEYKRLDALKNATRCFEQLKEYQKRIDFAYGKAETLKGMKELLAPESPAVISKHTQETFRRIKPKVEMWQQICSWQADTSKVRITLSCLHQPQPCIPVFLSGKQRKQNNFELEWS